jgi:hypothetical protein
MSGANSLYFFEYGRNKLICLDAEGTASYNGNVKKIFDLYERLIFSSGHSPPEITC